MSPARKYLLLQVPGWILAGTLAFGLWSWQTMPAWLALGLFLFWVGKDFVLYPFLREAYRSDVATGAARLIGRLGVVRKPVTPRGYVLVDGELWRARASGHHARLAAGTAVRVIGAERLTLVVEAEAGDE